MKCKSLGDWLMRSVWLAAMLPLGWTGIVHAQPNPLNFLSITPISDNDPLTNEMGRDRTSINSTAFKNESIVTVGNYQFTTSYREDGKLMVMRRDLVASPNTWEVRVTEFTSYNINDAHNVPVLGFDGAGYMHLAWGTHADPLLYTKSTTPIAEGQAMSFIGDAIGNSAALNTMTGAHETRTTYPNFIRIPGSDDLLFNYRTGGSGNGTYRITRYDAATAGWTWADQTWIANTDSSGLTYNAYPHNLSFDSQGGLHASWTYRYNSSSPTGHSGFQTNHNLYYAYSPNNGTTWYKDVAGTVLYPADINEQNSAIIAEIPEGSSLINTGTQAIDANDRPAIATWWAPRAHEPQPDHRRQYMFVGYDGVDWFTSQITHRRSDPNTPVPESQLGVNHMGRPQLLFDDYNRAYVIYKDNDNGGGVTVAYSQANSRDDWEFIQLTQTDYGRHEPTLDRARWHAERQMHILTQVIDGNSANGGSPLEIVEWDVSSAMGRVIKWNGQSGETWDSSSGKFTVLGAPAQFESFDHVTFDDAMQTTVHLAANVEAGKVVVDSNGSHVFAGPGALTAGSLSVVGGGSLELATHGNTYAGPTRVSNATLRITGNATGTTSRMIAADGGTLVMDSSDASTMSSSFEIWPTGVLEIGSGESMGNPFPDNPSGILNDGLIRVKTTETLSNVTGLGSIEIQTGAATLRDNGAFDGLVHIQSGALAIASNLAGIGSGSAAVVVEQGGQLRIDASGSSAHAFDLSGGGAGTLQIGPAVDVVFSDSIVVRSPGATFDVGAGATATVRKGLQGSGDVTKDGAGTMRFEGVNTYTGKTIVRDGVLIVDRSTGLGEVIVDQGGVLEATGTVGASLTASGGVVRIGKSEVPNDGILIQHDFAGPPSNLHGTAPDIAPGEETWIASPGFNADGSLDQSTGGSATLEFTPLHGERYTLDTTLVNVSGNANWIALGFANGQSAAAGSNERFITGNVVGAVWMLVRGDAGGGQNQAFRGLDSGPNAGTTDGVAWMGPLSNASPGGDIDMRILLDTTGGPGGWTATWLAKRPTDSVYHEVRSETLMLTETIDSIGLALANAGVTGTIQSFSLSVDVPGLDMQEARTLSVEEDFTLTPGAMLEMDLFDPADHDRLQVTGWFNAAGTLAVSLEAGAPSPQLGDAFEILEVQATSGSFEALVLPDLDSGLFWDTSELLSTGVLSVVDVLSGDHDRDGDVDGADFLHWQRSPAIGSMADWEAGFGAIPMLSGSSSVLPEPTARLLMWLAACVASFGRRAPDELSQSVRPPA